MSLAAAKSRSDGIEGAINSGKREWGGWKGREGMRAGKPSLDERKELRIPRLEVIRRLGHSC